MYFLTPEIRTPPYIDTSGPIVRGTCTHTISQSIMIHESMVVCVSRNNIGLVQGVVCCVTSVWEADSCQ